MADQTPNQIPNQPPNQLYSTWESLYSCLQEIEPEAVLAAFRDNKKNTPPCQIDDKLKKERRKRMMAWYLFFFTHVGEDDIWEFEEHAKLEEQDGHQGQLIDEDDAVDDDDEEEDEEEEEADKEEDDPDPRERMMLRQEIFADWRAGKHPFFYDDEDMPDYV